MNQKEAHEIVERLIVAIQRFRSMNDEELGDTFADISAELLPWSLGNPGVLPTLLKMAERPIAPGEMFNILYIAHELEPTIAAVYCIIHKEDLPNPELDQLMHLDTEIN